MYLIKYIRYWLLVCFMLAQGANAAVLPEERIDALYHSYEGGGVEVKGPSILIRKGITNNTSAFYNFYIDNITSASIDVEIGGSQYIEERTEESFGIDYLHGKTTMSLSLTNSSENDYEADTVSFSISQDFFGDLSNITMGYSSGSDVVGKRDDVDQSDVDRQSYRVSFSQILSTNATVALAWETITDEASTLNNSGVTLNNPYRSYSFGSVGGVRTFAPEIYPNTRTSNALAIRGNYFLPFRAAIHAEYRWFQDSWGVRGDTYGLSYVHPVGDWTFDFRYRLYDQTKADFYNDMFDFANQFNYMARDKELSTFDNYSIGAMAGASSIKGA